jgi:NAD(P)-dependent dehydrogenase (short-subunit alcohol dehydrogenase family)
MRVLIIGAGGTIGSAVSTALSARGHEVVGASRSSEVAVDIEDPASIRAMYESVAAGGAIDAVVSTTGWSTFKPVGEVSDEDVARTFHNKVVGQINLVREGMAHVADGGSFTLTGGVFSQRPWPAVPLPATANGAVESFGRAAALDLPRDQRLNVVSPGFITETAKRMGYEGDLTAAECAETYVKLVEGEATGSVVYPGAEGLPQA